MTSVNHKENSKLRSASTQYILRYEYLEFNVKPIRHAKMPKMARADHSTLYNKIESMETKRSFCRIKWGD